MAEILDIKDLRALTIEELEDLAVSHGEPKFRGKQLFDWLHNKRISDIDGLVASVYNVCGAT